MMISYRCSVYNDFCTLLNEKYLEFGKWENDTELVPIEQIIFIILVK